MSGPTFGVLRFPGSCDEHDALLACRRVGEADLVWHEETDLAGIDVVVVPGGFSYGDYLRTGAIARFAPVMEEVRRFADDGGPVLGICNGFQVLCEAGMLPGALLANAGTRFVCRQVEVTVEHVHTPFTRGLTRGQAISVPVKHQGGRFWAPPGELERIEAEGLVAFRYAPGHNPNGSANDIAGVASPGGNVVGLMPHPEHAVDLLTGSDDALALFRAVASSVAGPAAAGTDAR